MKIRKSVLKAIIREVLEESTMHRQAAGFGTFARKTQGSGGVEKTGMVGQKLKEKPVWKSEADNDGEYVVIVKRKEGGDPFRMYVVDANNKVIQDWGSHPSLDGVKKLLSKKLAM